MSNTRRPAPATPAAAFFALVSVAVFGPSAHAREFTLTPAHAATVTAAERAVNVTVRYTGKGVVDDSHRLWIWVFDTPDIGPTSMPIYEASVSTNGGSVSLDGLGGDRVWIAVAYDERGGFAGSAAPPSGSPVGIYSAADGRPAPVSTDKGSATVVFDDSVRMP